MSQERIPVTSRLMGRRITPVGARAVSTVRLRPRERGIAMDLDLIGKSGAIVTSSIVMTRTVC
jgi:hypothetical protein